MGGKVAIREKAKARPQSRDGKAASASARSHAPRATQAGAASARPGARKAGGASHARVKAATAHAPAPVEKVGGRRATRVRRRVRVARAGYPSPEQRLVAAVRRMYRGAVAYFRETRLEMRKVVWPSRRETGVYTLVVIAATAIVGLIIWVFDIGLSAVLRTIIR